MSRDAAAYAADYGVSADEAFRRLSIQGELSRLVDDIAKAIPDRFAGGWIEHAPKYRVVISLTGSEPVPASLELLSAGAPAPVVFQTGARHTLRELTAALLKLDAILATLSPDVGSGLDVRSNSVKLTASAKLSDATLAKLRGLVDAPIAVELGGIAQNLHTYGGQKVNFSGAYDCTTGFTVRDTHSQVRGVTTAGHCRDSGIRYYQNNTGSGYPMSLQSQANDDDQDAQSMAESVHDVFPQFWDGSMYRTVRQVVGVQNMYGDYVCHYGITTGYSCGTITDTTFDPGNLCGTTGGGDCYSSWIKVEGPSLKCWGGDSGGPWFTGGSAYGTLKAGSTSGTGAGDCEWVAFMTTAYLNLGVLHLVVLTG